MIVRLHPLLLLLCTTQIFLAACSPFYVLRGAVQEAGILIGREPIEKAASSPELTPEQQQKLLAVQDARKFAITIGLTPKDSFTTYSKVDRDVLSWIVVGSKPDSFKLAAWWFPIVGVVPYKGFFTEEDARCQAQRLERDGYETFVRGTDAFSTLGWFNDPVVTPMLRRSEVQLVNTVIHESTHSTVWVNGHVPFNETLANFVGTVGAVNYYSSLNQSCKKAGSDCLKVSEAKLKLASILRDQEFEFAARVSSLVKKLDSLYHSNHSREEKLRQREVVFETEIAPLHIKYPQMKILQSINNAEIVQLAIYMTGMDDFRALYERSGSWSCFFDKIREISENVASSGTNTDPFELLKKILGQPTNEQFCRQSNRGNEE